MQNNRKEEIIEGENDLRTLYPEIAEEWDAEANYPLLLTELYGGENDKVWWKCGLGHRWQASIKNRFRRKQKCPYCLNKKVWQGFNDLVTTHPQTASDLVEVPEMRTQMACLCTITHFRHSMPQMQQQDSYQNQIYHLTAQLAQ